MKPKYLKIAVMGLTAAMALNSCQEHIDEKDRYTFMGKTIATYLQDQEECSHFVDVLTRGGEIGLMKAYGQYTCFAPTNEAVEQFVKDQYEIYRSSVEANKLDPKVKVVNTGITSPELSELSDSMCTIISRNHILPAMYLGIDLKGNSIPHANMNERDLILGIDSVTKRYVIDKTAPIKSEEEVENGVVHIVEGVINPSSLGISTLLDGYPYFSIFNQALIETGLDKALALTDNIDYSGEGKMADGLYGGEVVPYPAKLRYGFTIFLETDETLAKCGITDFESLVKKCKEEYYKKDSKAWVLNEKTNKWEMGFIDPNTPYTDWRNPVKQFVAYHLIDRKIMYENLVCYKIELNAGGVYHSETNFPTNTPRVEYYVTMNNRILKVAMPRGDEKEKVYLNYAADGKGQNILVHAPNDFSKDTRYAEYRQEALNGSLNVMDNVLYYNEKMMREEVLNEIIRVDMSALFSELTNNRIRWNYINSTEKNRDAATYVPHGYCENLRVYTDNSRIFYLPPHDNGYFNYQGDEMMALGMYDFDCLLPPVPDGTYEIRLGYTANPSRGVAQVYLDNEVTGIPIDLTIVGKDAKIGYKYDKEGKDGISGLNGDEELITANDKDMKNRGYLKAPKSFKVNGIVARDEPRCLRAVIATKYLNEREHWLRFKNVGVRDPENAQLMLDYLEIVPIGYLRREDITVDQKRY